MANIGHFMIPADNVERAKHFYHTLLGWTIEPVRTPRDKGKMAAMQYHDIRTGAAREGGMNTGGLYRRQMREPILNFVMVDDIGAVRAKVEEPGGRITMPNEKIAGVGQVVMIQDTEGNVIGL